MDGAKDKMSDDVKKGITLMQEAGRALNEEFGFVLGGTRNLTADYPNKVEDRKRIQRQINGLVQGSLLLYLFAMWEDMTTETMRSHLTTDEKQKLRAYRHIRHCVGHRFSGGRADMYRQEFEDLYNAGQLKCVNWDRATDTIGLSDGMIAMECQQFMANLAQQLVARAASV